MKAKARPILKKEKLAEPLIAPPIPQKCTATLFLCGNRAGTMHNNDMLYKTSLLTEKFSDLRNSKIPNSIPLHGTCVFVCVFVPSSWKFDHKCRWSVCLFYFTPFSRYAEEVEARLRSIGLVCNIGYPPIDLPVAEVIDRITRAGTLYVIVVSAQNAIHRSCTLNILHGARQEHRNMPLDDAISFVARNFDTYLKVLREPFRGPPPGAYDPVYDRAYPPPPSHNPPVGGVPPAREKAMSTDELNAMIEKLKREKSKEKQV
ncbi:nuclear receptor coactivator 5-like [Hydractinia symbiolongicarpus]|uniref:nuclear receptor coactivator 5-like n=1 Tax=Hydractinia symbiolongicarpus TaxID=13093 RepID=UPI00254C8CB6|nr:nuclear receptor coactivator 5-like [Hydractinia symbiolongicarpus]XP_057290737.1 nuclear receptor coactivator 5-like [Hydractinia symbiolongicarpus]